MMSLQMYSYEIASAESEARGSLAVNMTSSVRNGDSSRF